MKKTETSTKKAKYVVNLTNIDAPEDIQLEFIKAKVLAGVKITEDEFKFIVRYGADLAFNTIDNYLDIFVKSTNSITIENNKLVKDIIKLINDSTKPKKPWYKRFFGWIAKPFKKNK